jgi:hypothetical protein
MIKGLILQEEINIININASQTGTYNYIKQTFLGLKEKIDSNTITETLISRLLPKMMQPNIYYYKKLLRSEHK